MNFLFSEEYDVWVGSYKDGDESGFCAVPLHLEVKAPKKCFIYGKGETKLKKVEILRFKEFSYQFFKEVCDKFGFNVLATMLNVRFEDMATRQAWYFLREIIADSTSNTFNRFQKVFDATLEFQKILKDKYGFDQIIRPYDNRCYCYGEIPFFDSILPIHYMGFLVDSFPMKNFPFFDVIKYERILTGFISAAILAGEIKAPKGTTINKDKSVSLPDLSCKDMVELVFGTGSGDLLEKCV